MKFFFFQGMKFYIYNFITRNLKKKKKKISFLFFATWLHKLLFFGPGSKKKSCGKKYFSTWKKKNKIYSNYKLWGGEKKKRTLHRTLTDRWILQSKWSADCCMMGNSLHTHTHTHTPCSFSTSTCSWVWRRCSRTARLRPAGRRPGRPAPTASGLAPELCPRSHAWCRPPEGRAHLSQVVQVSRSHRRLLLRLRNTSALSDNKYNSLF